MKRRPSNFTTEEVRDEECKYIKDERYEILARINSSIFKPDVSISHHRRQLGKSKSGFRGVYKHSDRKKKNSWRAIISFKDKQKYLGTYATKEEAARIYDKAAKIIYGSLAVLNFPESESRDQRI